MTKRTIPAVVVTVCLAVGTAQSGTARGGQSHVQLWTRVGLCRAVDPEGSGWNTQDRDPAVDRLLPQYVCAQCLCGDRAGP